MDISFLPQQIRRGVENSECIWEMRIRAGQPVITFTKTGRYYLSQEGLTEKKDLAIVATEEDIDVVLMNLSGQAIYRISEAVRQGVVCTVDGIRIGICGRFLTKESTSSFLTDYTSLCIRFPCLKFGLAEKILNVLMQNIGSTVIIAPPAGGKTTLLRDFAITLSNIGQNVVVIDENGEISLQNRTPYDCIRFCNKREVFPLILHTLHPDFVLCDELRDTDSEAVVDVMLGGTNIIATAHAKSVEDFHLRFKRLTDRFQTEILLNKQENGIKAILYQNGKIIREVVDL